MADRGAVGDRSPAPRSPPSRCWTGTRAPPAGCGSGSTYAPGPRRPGVGLRQAGAVRRVPAPDGGHDRHGSARGPLLRRPRREAPLRIPRAYYAAHGDEPTEYVMVLEDLEAAGCTFTDRLETHAEERAASSSSPRTPARPLLERPPLRRRASLGPAGHARPVRRQARRQGPPAVRRRVPARLRRSVRACTSSTTSASPSCGTTASRR